MTSDVFLVPLNLTEFHNLCLQGTDITFHKCLVKIKKYKTNLKIKLAFLTFANIHVNIRLDSQGVTLHKLKNDWMWTVAFWSTADKKFIEQ